MTRFIALLRGINISGKNKISMPELKTAFVEAGYADVCTHLNSGTCWKRHLTGGEVMIRLCTII